MRTTRPALVLLAAAALSCCTSQNQSPWDALNAQTLAGFNASNYDGCIDAGKKAVALAEAENDPKSEHLVTSLNYIGMCEENKGDPAAARASFERSRVIAEKAGSNLQPNILTTIYNNLATLAWSEGRRSDAEVLLKENLSRVEKTFGHDNQEVAGSKANLGYFYMEQGRYDEAQPLIEDALAIGQHVLAANNPRLVSYQDAAGQLYTKQGKFDQAEAMFERSLELEKKDPRIDAYRVQTLRAVGDLAVAKGDDARAQATYEQAIDLAAKAYPDPRVIAEIEGDLAVLHARQGRDVEAEPLFHKAIAAQEKAVGMDATALVKNLEGLAAVCERTGKGDEAAALRQRAAAMGPSIH